MDTTLILIGVGCIIAAIIGGGVKLVQIELSQVKSVQRQAMLGVFGLILVVGGLASGGHLSFSGGGDGAAQAIGDKAEVVSPPKEEAPATVAPSATVEPPSKVDDAPAGLPKAEEPAAPPPPAEPATAIAYKVDIFWCVTDDSESGNEAKAQRIASGLESEGIFARIRARPLSQATNAQASYGITANIVRFDPGERDMADRVAQIASQAARTAFAPAPALPGSPSLDYLSVFVCTVH